MIRFCEDCGSKNQIYSFEFIAGKSGFRCSSCGYLTPVSFKPDENRILENSNRFFSEANKYSDISSVFLFHTEMGILKHHMPEPLEINDIDLLGRNLVTMFESGCSEYSDIKEMVLSISNKFLLVRKACQRFFLIFTCKSPSLPPKLYEALYQAIQQGI